MRTNRSNSSALIRPSFSFFIYTVLLFASLSWSQIPISFFPTALISISSCFFSSRSLLLVQLKVQNSLCVSLLLPQYSKGNKTTATRPVRKPRGHGCLLWQTQGSLRDTLFTCSSSDPQASSGKMPLGLIIKISLTHSSCPRAFIFSFHISSVFTSTRCSFTSTNSKTHTSSITSLVSFQGHSPSVKNVATCFLIPPPRMTHLTLALKTFTDSLLPSTTSTHSAF